LFLNNKYPWIQIILLGDSEMENYSMQAPIV
jgi:hypothetical protein